MSQELGVFAGLLAVLLIISFLAARWRTPTDPNRLEEWGVAGRAFGNWVTWFLIGGSSFTAYTLIAVPAYSWGVGAIGFYAIPYALITIPITYVVSTRGWSVAHAHGFVTSAEFARVRFGSRPLALAVALTGIAATLPYIAVQLIALEAVFKVVGIRGPWPLLISLGLVSISTFRSGLRAPALLSIAKDVLLVWLVLSAVLMVAMSGGWGPAFATAGRQWSADQSPATGLLLTDTGQWTYLSLIIGSALSVFAYPHMLTAILAAKDRSTIRRNAAALPVYCLVLALMDGDTNTIAPMIFHTLFPAWCAGIAYATLAVAALIPTAIMSISTANLFTRSIYVEYLRPRASAAEETRVSRWTSLVVKFGAAGIILLLDPTYSADFQLIGSIIILQALPAVFFGVLTGWFHRWALMLGLLAGLGSSVWLLYLTPQYSLTGVLVKAHFGGSTVPLQLFGLDSKISVYIGLLTLLLNLATVVVVTAALKLLRISPNVDLTRPDDYNADDDRDGLDRLDFLLDGTAQRVGAHTRR
jgi:SSS family solute:Na+ symporter